MNILLTVTFRDFLGLPLYIDTVFNAAVVFAAGLITNNLPVLAVNILSRIQVNIVDRFIVIFGGYFISRGLVRLI